MRQISKSLDSIIAQATFRAIQLDARGGFEDLLFLELISSPASLSYQLLSSKLEPQQLDHIKSNISRITEVTAPPVELSHESVDEIDVNELPRVGEVGEREANVESDAARESEASRGSDAGRESGAAEVITPSLFYDRFLTSLIEHYRGSVRLTTLHALHFVVSNNQTAASRLLKLYGVGASMLEYEITQYNPNGGFVPLLSLGIRRDSNQTDKTDQTDNTNQPNRPNQSAKGELARPRQRVKPHPLSKFGIDLTQLARDGAIDPVVGRERETERVVEILSRRKKNNPVLVGEAGVGKSAIVEGLALRIAEGDVPHTIRDKHLFSIDISSLVAGTKFRGDFEQRIYELLTALKQSGDTIIFIDEIHTIVGAGSTQGSLDTANILKPALARGEIQTIGATTFDEYRNTIESDSALDRRLQKVVVEPTSEEQSIEILINIAPSYEAHHRVIYSEEAIAACVELSARYITNRYLPDKAIDLMDEAGAHSSIGEIVERAPRVIQRTDIERIITAQTGIDVEALTKSERERLQRMEAELNSRVVGQRSAVSKLSRTIRRSRAGLADENRPIGVFMFVGATGVGKTHLAKELSKWMFGTKRSLIRLDMSEYGESHNASRLIGSPPGYVGYGEGGELSEAVRRNPYSVVLLDEIEKAHPDIYNVMLQIFDEGQLTDGSGRKIDFRNTIIIMTSNVGSVEAVRRPLAIGYDTNSKQRAHRESAAESYRAAMERRFAPEFINRIDEVLMFGALQQDDIEKIVSLELERIFERTRSRGYDVRITRAARKTLAARGYESKYGARALRRTLQEMVEEPLSELIIDGRLKQGGSVVIERERGGATVRLRHCL